MRNIGYLVMLIFTFLGSIWLQIFLKVRVLQQVRRLVMTIIPVLLIFLLWDYAAVSMSHWTFDSLQILPLKRFFGFLSKKLFSFLWYLLPRFLLLKPSESRNLVGDIENDLLLQSCGKRRGYRNHF